MSNIKKFDQEVWIKDRLSIGDDSTLVPRVTIDMSGKTDAIFIPVGDDSQRPINVSNTTGLTNTVEGNGYFRYNKQTEKFEGYEDLQWKNFITLSESMSFIPNYYVYDESEFLQAFADVITYGYGGANIYIADIIGISEDRTLDFTGINIYGAGGIIRFYDSHDNTIQITNKIKITKGKPFFTNVLFSGSDSTASNDFRIAETRTIFDFIGDGADYDNNDMPHTTFENCTFADIVGQSGATELKPMIIYSNNIKAYASIVVKFTNCNFVSHGGSAGSGQIDYKGLVIKYTGNIQFQAASIRLYVYGFKTDPNAINNTGNLFGIDGNFNSEPKFYSDETAWINNSTYNSTNQLVRTSTFHVLKEEQTMLDSDYLFFNDSTGSNGVKNNMKKIKKSNLLSASNIQVEPDMSIQFAHGNELSGVSDMYYDYNTNIAYLPDLNITNLSGSTSNVNLLLQPNGDVITGTTGTTINYLDDLLDVTAPTPTDGDFLIYDSSTSNWVSSGITGDQLSAGTGIIITDTPGYVTISVDSTEVTPSLEHTYIAFGSASDQITGSSELTWDNTYLQVSGTSSESVVISSTGSYYLGSPTTNGSWRFRINDDGDLITEKLVGSTWTIGQTISV